MSSFANVQKPESAVNSGSRDMIRRNQKCCGMLRIISESRSRNVVAC